MSLFAYLSFLNSPFTVQNPHPARDVRDAIRHLSLLCPPNVRLLVRKAPCLSTWLSLCPTPERCQARRVAGGVLVSPVPDELKDSNTGYANNRYPDKQARPLHCFAPSFESRA